MIPRVGSISLVWSAPLRVIVAAPCGRAMTARLAQDDGPVIRAIFQIRDGICRP